MKEILRLLYRPKKGNTRAKLLSDFKRKERAEKIRNGWYTYLGYDLLAVPDDDNPKHTKFWIAAKGDDPCFVAHTKRNLKRYIQEKHERTFKDYIFEHWEDDIWK